MKFTALILVAGALMATAMPTESNFDGSMSRRSNLNPTIQSSNSSSVMFTGDRNRNSTDENAIIIRGIDESECYWSRCTRGCQNNEYHGVRWKVCGPFDWFDSWLCCPNTLVE
ncbi:Protein of unknown function [Pyronema omphalodes CBS 100304]|uniref:Uncharacterized protein n=1 Tax=Pyronema omphalodes (strain CBS 100304) TaxID=1076935 RepID=U4LNB4_PYROM|nr:Protein of unknown function [Pyronema omphalodes CBS 100304]